MYLERAPRIELGSKHWQCLGLPLHHARIKLYNASHIDWRFHPTYKTDLVVIEGNAPSYWAYETHVLLLNDITVLWYNLLESNQLPRLFRPPLWPHQLRLHFVLVPTSGLEPDPRRYECRIPPANTSRANRFSEGYLSLLRGLNSLSRLEEVLHLSRSNTRYHLAVTCDSTPTSTLKFGVMISVRVDWIFRFFTPTLLSDLAIITITWCPNKELNFVLYITNVLYYQCTIGAKLGWLRNYDIPIRPSQGRVFPLHYSHHIWYPRQESNLDLKLRRLQVYPLTYGDENNRMHIWFH